MPLRAAYGSSPTASATGRATSRKPCRIRCPSCGDPVQQQTSSASGSPTPPAGGEGSGGDEGQGRGDLEGREPAELPRRRPDELLEVGQQGRRVGELEEDRAAE